MVNIGSYVDANNPIVEIVDNSQLHLDLYYMKKILETKSGANHTFPLTNNQAKNTMQMFTPLATPLSKTPKPLPFTLGKRRQTRLD
ncbi:MAG: hypothetical protein IPL74_18805 [Bacteroidetes bacterium]|nr:hypothetical protein [Bacteroidota bacterium]